MCGRYRLSSTEEEVAEFFEAELTGGTSPTLQHRAVAAGAGDPSSRMRARDRKRTVGPRAILGQGHFDWLQADQRLQREDDRGTGLPRLLD